MYICAPPPHRFISLKFPELHSSSKLNDLQVLRSFGLSKRNFKLFSVTVSSLSSMSEASNYIPAAPIFLPEGPWQQIPGEVTAAKGFKAAGMYGGLRAKGEKPELALVSCDVDATVAGQRINKVWIIDSTVKKSLLSQLAMMLQFMCYEPCSFKDE
eukprot:XP_024442305.1 arginine biosynthesis bifunctional protein ArgJ, chloroplastic-like isoform X2 [Populus trichocarpa]